MDLSVAHSDLVLCRREGAVARLTLNAPTKANALSRAMIETLSAALSKAVAHPDVRVVVIDAVGKVFCAGHDLKELRESDDKAEHRRLFEGCSRLMLAIAASPRPVIAKVQGAAVAAGCQLVASCDLAYAADEARFAVSGIDLGLFCSTPSVALSRAVGRKAALEMLLTGRFIDASRAADLGLINRAVPAAELESVVADAAAVIAAKAPDALTLGKAMFARQVELGVEDAYALASERMAENLGFASAKDGIDAFLARPARSPSAAVANARKS